MPYFYNWLSSPTSLCFIIPDHVSSGLYPVEKLELRKMTMRLLKMPRKRSGGRVCDPGYQTLANRRKKYYYAGTARLLHKAFRCLHPMSYYSHPRPRYEVIVVVHCSRQRHILCPDANHPRQRQMFFVPKLMHFQRIQTMLQDGD
jgi:hypothetical protein